MSEILVERTSELERSNAELEQFAYVASHDLQEPLRMIVSFLQLLAQRYQGRLDKEANDFIGFAVDGAKRMKQLIDDLLEYSRAGLTLEICPVSLEAVVERVLETLALRMKETGATLVCGRLPTVLGEEAGFYRLLLNLIGNALKFRGPARPEIQINAEAAGAHALISVADNGIGISPEHHDRIFLMFQRLHARSEYDGTGVGLAVCKRIVESYGGRIWVQSEPGKGSVFRFTLALAPAHALP
jgi:light-regulated signal transduction histidine kinase (bacteriophytochrome)